MSGGMHDSLTCSKLAVDEAAVDDVAAHSSRSSVGLFACDGHLTITARQRAHPTQWSCAQTAH